MFEEKSLLNYIIFFPKTKLPLLKSHVKELIFHSKQDSDHNIHALGRQGHCVNAVILISGPQQHSINTTIQAKVIIYHYKHKHTHTYTPFPRAKIYISLVFLLPRALQQKQIIMIPERSITLYLK